MKLLHRTALNHLLLAIPLVVIGTVAGHYAVRHAVNDELDEQLQHHAELIAARLATGESELPGEAPDQFVQVLPERSTGIAFQDTLLYNAAEEGVIPWRMVRYPAVRADGGSATVVIARATVEYEDLVTTVALVIGGLLLLVFLGNFLVDRWLNTRLWRPFHHTLDQLAHFQVDAPRNELPRTGITEFNAMNGTLNAMMAKLQRDFTAQKRFSEQAAHELQTPLAVMQGKLDELIQMPELGELEAGMIEVLYRARERMGRTVQNMLLLARIGNMEYAAAPVDWQALFQDQAALLAGLMERRAVHFQLHVDKRCELRLHPVLAELVVANLLRNAVQHNHEGGSINVRIGSEGFVVTNSGPTLNVDPERLFERFTKGDPSSEGSGLGLSMVKEVCDNAGLRLEYTEAAGVHTVVVHRTR